MVVLQQQLHVALAAAFTRGELEQLLGDTFGERLESIAEAGTMPEMALEVVRWAERTNRLPKLAVAVIGARPLRPEVAAIIERLARLGLAASAQAWNGTGWSMPDGDMADLVASLERAIQGDPKNKRTGLIDELQELNKRLAGYIEENERRMGASDAEIRATKERVYMLEEAMRRRWWPWVIAGMSLAVGVGGVVMAVEERFF